MKKRILSFLIIFTFIMSVSYNIAFADYYTGNEVLYSGMQNSEVYNLQGDLKYLGYYNGESTGYFGYYTKQAVLSFQRDNYLAADGVVGHQTASKIKVYDVLKTAKSYQGVPYVWGGESPSGFDCSGFVQYVFKQNGIYIPRTAAQQYNVGTWVSKSQLMPGDLVFFSTYKAGASHVGIYLGNNKFIQESSGWGYATISDLNNSYFLQHYIGAKRVIN